MEKIYSLSTPTSCFIFRNNLALENSFSIDFPQELTLFPPVFSQSLIYTSSSPLPSPPSFGHPEPAGKCTLSSKWWSRLCVRKQDSSYPLPLSYLSMKGLLVLETGHVLLTLFHMLEHFLPFLHTLWAETIQWRPHTGSYRTLIWEGNKAYCPQN